MPLMCDEWVKQPQDWKIANDIKIARKVAGLSAFPFDCNDVYILSVWGDVVLASIDKVFLIQYHTRTHQIIWTAQIASIYAKYMSENVIIYLLDGEIQMLINTSDGTQYNVC